jgi:X-Pro dipeptidyl-peptidase
MDHMGMWWEALKANNVQRKLWLLRAGHEDPFESRRAEWVNTLHRWFDRYLYGVNNGIENEPKVTIEDSSDTWGDYGEWPIPGTQNVDLYLRAVADTAEEGVLASVAGGGSQNALSFVANNTSEGNLMNNPTGSQANRRVFLSPTLTKDLRMSGTATADLLAQFGQVANLPAGENCSVTTVNNPDPTGPAKTFRNCPSLSVMIVDLGPSTQNSRTSDGVTLGNTRHCWGVGAPGNVCEGKAVGDACTMPEDDDDPLWRVENACYADPVKPLTNVTAWRVTRGVRDVQNRESLVFQDAAMTPVTITDSYRLRFPTMPNEHTFKAGNQIAIIVGGINTSMVSSTGRPNNVPVTLDTRVSKVTLPIVGGYEAAAEAGAVAPDPTAPVSGTVPATLSLTVGPAATFSAFTPGVTRTYEASTTANVISSAGNAVLSVADPSSQNTGHLVNGSFFMPQPLQARARNASNTGTAYNNVGSSASPLNLLAYDGPVSNDAVSLQFSQLVNANDALRTGSYGKTLTFTLSTTEP